MASVTLSVNSPVVTTADFHVVVRNSSGGLIRDTMETNDPFSISGLVSGDYTMDVTYGDRTVTECFTIPACNCIDVVSAEIVERESMPGYYDLVFLFDFSLFQPTLDCGFQIHTINEDGSGFTNSYTRITGVPQGGDIYKYTAFMGHNSKTTYSFYKTSAPLYEAGEVCIPPTTIGFSCKGAFDGPISSFSPDVSINLNSGVYTIDIDYKSCGDTCKDVTWNYSQQVVTGGATPDIGTFTDTTTCSPLASTSHIINPQGTLLANGGVIYNLVGTDCCGNIFTIRVNLCAPLIDFAGWSTTSQPINSNIRIVIPTTPGCNANPICPTTPFTVQWRQQSSNVAIGSIPDAGTGVMTINCGALPDTHDFTVHPAPLASGQTQAKYDVTIWSCCANYGRVAIINP